MSADDLIKDGGPAFPLANAEASMLAEAAEDLANPALNDAERTYYRAKSSALHGMSLRDHFAGQALASGDASNWRDNNYRPSDGLSVIENTARHAYLIADAMLKARAR